MLEYKMTYKVTDLFMSQFLRNYPEKLLANANMTPYHEIRSEVDGFKHIYCWPNHLLQQVALQNFRIDYEYTAPSFVACQHTYQH